MWLPPPLLLLVVVVVAVAVLLCGHVGTGGARVRGGQSASLFESLKVFGFCRCGNHGFVLVGSILGARRGGGERTQEGVSSQLTVTSKLFSF